MGHGTFVGREAELSELSAGVEEAIEGQGRGFLVLGDAGMGKTRLASEVADLARHAGVLVLWGRCWEAGGAPPFWPWTEALRAAPVDAPAPLAALLPELAADEPDHRGADPGRARFALFDSVGSFLRQVASERPVLVVLDDLHAADLPSLLLLEHLLGGGLRQSRVAVVALAREHEPGRCDELLAAALRIRRLARPIRLAGLTRSEVSALIEQHVDAPPPVAVVDAVAEATEGNPLFVEELAALIGRGQADIGVGPLPAGIRETIRTRFAPLPPEVRDVLSTAAVVGREFDTALVAQVAERTEQDIAAAVDVAVRSGVVTAVGPRRYRFAHILVRDVLYDELPRPDRAPVHARVGQALATRHQAEPDDHLDELAHHFTEAASIGEEERAVAYLLRAGERAEARLAHERAVGHYERALALAESTKSGGATRLCDTLLALGRAYGRVGRTEAAKDAFRRAGALARQSADTARLAHAALGLAERVAFQQQDDATVAFVEEALAAVPEEAAATRARLLAALARLLGYTGKRERMESTAREAVAAARSVGDDDVLADALTAWQLTLWSPDRVAERLGVAAELLSLAERSGDRERSLEGHMSQMICALEQGDGRQFDRSLAAYERVAEELRQPRYRFVALTRRAMRELMQGEYEAGVRHAEEALRLGNRCEEPDAEPVYHGVLSLPARDTGDELDAVEAFFVDFSSRHTSAGSRALLAGLALARGDLASTRRDLDAVAAVLDDLPKDMDWLLCLAFAAEAAHAVGDKAVAARVYPLLLPYASRCALVAGAVCFAGAIAHYLGLLAGTLGRVDEAVAHFEAAEATHAELGARPWVARTVLEHGRLLLDQPDAHSHARGAALVTQARGMAEELGMTAFLARVPDAPSAGTTSPPSPSPTTATLRRDGARWVVCHGTSAFTLPDAKGLHHLATLLARPGSEVHVLDLVGGGMRDGDAGPVLDAAAKDAYRQRLHDLREEIDEAESWADPERAALARAELEAITAELAAGVGLGGRDRRSASATDRARVSVRKALVRTLREIARHDAALGRYLETTVRTGVYCVYEPDPRFPVTWEL